VKGGAALDADALNLKADLLTAAGEELDDTLAMIQLDRRKQRLLRAIHEALRHPLVHEGVRLALERLAEEVSFDLVLVLYHLREDDREAIHYLVFRGPALEFASGARVAEALDQALRRGRATRPGGAEVLVSNAEVEHRRVLGGASVDLRLEGASDAILGALGYRECHETVLIAGLDQEAIVGKLVVAARRPLGTYERDVLALLADVLQKRVVDYNAAGEALRRSFALPTVVRLLDEERPWARLAPRAAEISILFADVAGFTALSERCLADPTAVGDFVEAWSRGVTQLVWKHGGVFDKLVGDCVIGLFGPPYFELTAAQRAEACVRAAVDMVRFTRALIDHPACARIKAAGLPLGVAVGLNDGPASVGMFGLDQDYTAFSSAMNNTARLQGMATRDEVLVMAPMAGTLEAAGLGWRFGPRREGKAKNVAEPLVFRALDLDSIDVRESR
jgi:adenylate cyclase